ncbi:unnamed protein product [Gongylonema pulchrum]|uniref:A_deaminase domain-containing protein n=1 Tax=Gongylonema pulchrum TaxID=637853 RepID=A0A183DRZ0_9BILA|nr:unnamed protein product [Gongylonema pulchrum]
MHFYHFRIRFAVLESTQNIPGLIMPEDVAKCLQRWRFVSELMQQQDGEGADALDDRLESSGRSYEKDTVPMGIKPDIFQRGYGTNTIVSQVHLLRGHMVLVRKISSDVEAENLKNLMRAVCRRMPKCEFHAHLSGCISRRMLKILGSRRRASEFIVDNESALSTPSRSPRNLEEAFRLFPLIQAMVVTVDVIREFNEDNVVYLELRSTPRQTDCMSKEEYVRALISGVIHAKQLYPHICVRILLSIDRRQTVEQAEETVNLAMKYGLKDGKAESDAIIIGVEISGDPRHDARKFLPLLEKARGHLPVISFHLAEIKENLDEVHDCLRFGPTRLGHATFLHEIQDDVLREICLRHVYNNRIPIDVLFVSSF